MLGGWLGRIAGCNLAKPVKNGDHRSSCQTELVAFRVGEKHVIVERGDHPSAALNDQ